MLRWLWEFSRANTLFYIELQSILGFLPRKIKFYHQAFCHSSIEDEKYGNNERLELLGDAIFNAVITEYLFHNKDTNEPDLGKQSLQCGRRVDVLKLWLTWK